MVKKRRIHSLKGDMLDEQTIDRNTEWRSVHGEIKPLCELDDNHILNLISYVKNVEYYAHSKKILKVLNELASERGLDKKKITSRPYAKDGMWYYYDEIEMKHVQIAGEKKLNRKVCRKCRRSNSSKYKAWGREDDEIWNDRRVVMCYEHETMDKHSGEGQTPENCPYKLEHCVIPIERNSK